MFALKRFACFAFAALQAAVEKLRAMQRDLPRYPTVRQVHDLCEQYKEVRRLSNARNFKLWFNNLNIKNGSHETFWR